MRPLTVITGILLGSCLAITVSLAAVLVVFLVFGDDYPRVQHEFGSLVSSISIFFGMTTITGLSFYALLINHGLWLWAQALMWAGVMATTWYFLP